MPSTPVMGNGRPGNSLFQDGGTRFPWLTEKRLVSALSAKQEYEVRQIFDDFLRDGHLQPHVRSVNLSM